MVQGVVLTQYHPSAWWWVGGWTVKTSSSTKIISFRTRVAILRKSPAVLFCVFCFVLSENKQSVRLVHFQLICFLSFL